MKYSFLFFVFCLFILKINPSKQVRLIEKHKICHPLLLKASFKNQGSHETQKARKMFHGKRHSKTRSRKRTRKNKKPLKKGGSRKQSLRKKTVSSRQSIVFTGGDCDFVDFGAIRNSGLSCSDGSKMVLKNS